MTPDPFALVEGTWPAAGYQRVGPWTIREGRGGGQRVSAASLEAPFEDGDIATAEQAMRALGQAPLFMIRPGDEALDRALEGRGYRIKDPVEVWVGPAEQAARGHERSLAAIFADYPLAIMAEIWRAGGIGPGRLDVMARARGPKAYILGREGDRPAGVAFVALHGTAAMVHALEVRPAARRRGVALRMMQAAASWAISEGAERFAALSVVANTAVHPLWRRLGMEPVCGYHYRVRDEEAQR